MKRIVVIALISYLAFVAEFVLYNSLGSWGKPELLLLVVVFFNLYLGIRYSIVAALFCGLLKDASGVAVGGAYVFFYIVVAYVSTLIRRYLYQQGSHFSRVFVTLLSLIASLSLQTILTSRFYEIHIDELFVNVWVPQLTVTLLVVPFVFALLRDVSVFFVIKSKV